MNVEEIMSRNPRTCRVSDKLNRPAQLMWENACGCIPVLDDGGQVIGMVTDRDVCMAAYTQGKRLEDIDVSTAMSHAVHSCLPSDSVETAAAIMQKGRVRRLPVLTPSGELVGLVSLHDMAIAAGDSSSRRGKENLIRAVESTLSAVCGRHSHQAAAA